jgi:hypothetical protein
VKELRFHREVYAGTAVDEATKRLARFADFELAEEPTHWVVRLRCKDEGRERQVAGVLANWALGLTVEKGRS